MQWTTDEFVIRPSHTRRPRIFWRTKRYPPLADAERFVPEEQVQRNQHVLLCSNVGDVKKLLKCRRKRTDGHQAGLHPEFAYVCSGSGCNSKQLGQYFEEFVHVPQEQVGEIAMLQETRVKASHQCESCLLNIGETSYMPRDVVLVIVDYLCIRSPPVGVLSGAIFSDFGSSEQKQECAWTALSRCVSSLYAEFHFYEDERVLPTWFPDFDWIIIGPHDLTRNMLSSIWQRYFQNVFATSDHFQEAVDKCAYNVAIVTNRSQTGIWIWDS